MRQTALQLQQIVNDTEHRLGALSEAESQARPSSDKWSRKEILGHLIDSASNNHQRFVRAQFQPQLVFPGYAQVDWNRVQHYQSEAWENLVRLWASYNRHLAHVIAVIPESAGQNSCESGAGKPVTLEFLFADSVAPREHHLGHILASLVCV